MNLVPLAIDKGQNLEVVWWLDGFGSAKALAVCLSALPYRIPTHLNFEVTTRLRRNQSGHDVAGLLISGLRKHDLEKSRDVWLVWLNVAPMVEAGGRPARV